jgi:hypothetical protein
MEQEVTELTINGTKYVRADTVREQPKPGKRAVVVVDRGWIFAGDVDEESKPGRILLTRVVWVFRWDGVGFAAMIENPKSKTDIRKVADVDIPVDSEVFRVPVGDSWGL